MTARNDGRPGLTRAIEIDLLERRQLLSAAIPTFVWRVNPVVRSTHTTALTVYPAATAVRSQSTTADTGYAVPADVVLGPVADPADSPATSPFTPAQVRRFYNADDVAFNGITGDGTGQTIAIIDAYDQPGFVNSTDPNFSTSDLAVFDARFGIPNPPSFTKVAETTNGAVPTAVSADWSIEASLDVEWAHAMAPGASIVLVETDSNSISDLVDIGAKTAKMYPNVSVVSMSFVDSESSSDPVTSTVFNSTTQNVTFLASTGDQGAASTGFPSFAGNVVAVGGTSITTADSLGNYGSETTWNNSHGATGGGPSVYESRPGYQASLSVPGSTRATPDVSFDADPLTGVYVYDSSYGSGGAWYRVGGTSLSAPCWAGLIAVANQGRGLLGLSPLDGASGVLPRLYNLPATDFHDVTTGNNAYSGTGYSAGVGYDMATGLGTPIADTLIPDLAGATVAGTVFIDYNGNGQFDTNDVGLSGQQVYLDLNGNGVRDSTEPVTSTDSAGRYSFTDLAGHVAGTVRLVSALTGGTYGYVQVPIGSALATAYGQTQTLDIAYTPTRYSTSADSAAYTLRLDPAGVSDQILLNGSPVNTVAAAAASSFTFDLTGVDDSLTIDATNGNPVPAGGVAVNGVSGANDRLALVGSPVGDSYTVNAGSILFSGTTITETNLAAAAITPGAGLNTLNVASGSVAVTAATPGGGIARQVFSSIAVGPAAVLTAENSAARGDRHLFVTGMLSIAPGGRFDLGGNDLVIQNGSLAAVTSVVATATNFGRWTGPGLTSSLAANDGQHLISLGVANGSIITAFDGYLPASSDVLVKCTDLGDANLDGRIDGSDYSLLDAGYLGKTLTGWANGDFNYDGVVDGTDYSLADNAYNNAGSPT